MPSSVAKRTVASELPVEAAMVVDTRDLFQVAVGSELASKFDPTLQAAAMSAQLVHPRFASPPSASLDRISAASCRVQSSMVKG